MLTRMKYVGKIRRLKGKTALVMPHSGLRLKAQFDDITIDKGVPTLKHCVAHGWTTFDRSDFEPIEENENESITGRANKSN